MDDFMHAPPQAQQTQVVRGIKRVFQLTEAQDRAFDVLISDAVHVALGGGARSGKTFLLVMTVIMRALKSPGSRHAIFRFRFNALKASVIMDTLPKVMSLKFPGLMAKCDMNKTDWFLTLPNGSEIWFGGLDDSERTEKILGMEFATIYFNECSQIPWASIVLALTRLAQQTDSLKLKALYDFNPPSKLHWTYISFVDKRNPETKKPYDREFDHAFYLINPGDNTDNLDPGFIRMLEGLPEKARNRFLLGRFADDTDGAYWSQELLAQNRKLGHARDPIPEFLRIVVAVDPSGCSGPEDTRSDEIGITVEALGTDNHGYLLEDLSGKYSPEEWGSVTVEAFRRHRADRVVGEVNFGGDMVRAVIHAVDSDIPYSEVHATRGKVVRAEPIAALYEQNKIHHVGHFPDLEDQLCSLSPGGYMGLRSPDRADSAIWGFTELFPQMTKKAQKAWVPPQVNTVKRGASRLDTGHRKASGRGRARNVKGRP